MGDSEAIGKFEYMVNAFLEAASTHAEKEEVKKIFRKKHHNNAFIGRMAKLWPNYLQQFPTPSLSTWRAYLETLQIVNRFDIRYIPKEERASLGIHETNCDACGVSIKRQLYTLSDGKVEVARMGSDCIAKYKTDFSVDFAGKEVQRGKKVTEQRSKGSLDLLSELSPAKAASLLDLLKQEILPELRRKYEKQLHDHRKKLDSELTACLGEVERTVDQLKEMEITETDAYRHVLHFLQPDMNFLNTFLQHATLEWEKRLGRKLKYSFSQLNPHELLYITIKVMNNRLVNAEMTIGEVRDDLIFLSTMNEVDPKKFYRIKNLLEMKKLKLIEVLQVLDAAKGIKEKRSMRNTAWMERYGRNELENLVRNFCTVFSPTKDHMRSIKEVRPSILVDPILTQEDYRTLRRCVEIIQGDPEKVSELSKRLPMQTFPSIAEHLAIIQRKKFIYEHTN